MSGGLRGSRFNSKPPAIRIIPVVFRQFGRNADFSQASFSSQRTAGLEVAA
jgi:hypothetical protein